MSQILTCPHCRNAMTVDETYAGLVVECPSCRGSVAVPVPVGIFLGMGDEGPRKRASRYDRGPSGGRTLLWGCAGVPVVLILGLVIAALFRVIGGGVTDLGIIAAAAICAMILMVAFVIDRILFH